MANTFCQQQTKKIGGSRPPNWTNVSLYFEQYQPTVVRTLLLQVQKQFGWHGDTWFFTFNDGHDNQSTLNFFFQDPHDATLFALKFSGFNIDH